MIFRTIGLLFEGGGEEADGRAGESAALAGDVFGGGALAELCPRAAEGL